LQQEGEVVSYSEFDVTLSAMKLFPITLLDSFAVLDAN
jgi:hypothetical protein